jgi:glutamate racemase
MTNSAEKSPLVLVFDSGLGGLTVLREISRQRPDLHLVYVADDAAFPYGLLDDQALTDRVVTVVGNLIAQLNLSLVVIACNTASTLALPSLRNKFSVPFVGTIPAVKPACERSVTKSVSVLATPGTVRRDYTQALIREYGAGSQVTLVGSEHLAELAERALQGELITDDEIVREIRACFVDGVARTDTIVLACTHYPLIIDRLRTLSPWPVEWIDPAEAIARRVSSLLPVLQAPTSLPIEAYFTSGREPTAALIQTLTQFRAKASQNYAFKMPV